MPARRGTPAKNREDAAGDLLAAPRPEPVPPQSATPKLWGRGTALSLMTAVAILVGLASLVDLDGVWREISACDKGLAALGMICHYATYQLRGIRWRRTLRHLHGWRTSWKFTLLVFFYNFIDNIVPAKLGDVYGAHLARINLGVTRSAALGSIVFGRMIDAWVVLVAAIVSSSFVFSDRLPESVVWALILGGVIAAAATIVLLTFTLAKKLPQDRLPETLRRRIEAFQAGMWPRRRELASIAGLTLLIWTLETCWILLLARSFGIELGFGQLVFLTMIPLLASAFPLTPSGVGVVELSLYGSLRALDVPGTLAASLTVLNRFIDFWLHILLGVLIWLLRKPLGLRTWREVPIEEKAQTEETAADTTAGPLEPSGGRG